MKTCEPGHYVGRFAPSPTGPLHFGSLVAATASYLQSRANNGRWLLRIEDIDPPRQQPGADAQIIATLDHYGFEWHGDVIYQSSRHASHIETVERLLAEELVYRCMCSRRELADQPRCSLGIVYPGTCRQRNIVDADTAIRVRTSDAELVFTDGLQGRLSRRLENESGDFVIQRRDGLIAYHLAVVVDDQIDGITEIVRGIDLLETTPRHIWLQQLLGYASPSYMHVPVITHENGDKLSKLTGAPGVPDDDPEKTLVSALLALRQNPPEYLPRSSLQNVWSWAVKNWQPGKLSGVKAIVNLP